jgi:hypothetical protein
MHAPFWYIFGVLNWHHNVWAEKGREIKIKQPCTSFSRIPHN